MSAGKTAFSFIILFVLVLNLSLNSFSQNDSIPKSLKILSWNIYMLPGPFLSPGKVTRAHLIAEKIKSTDYDVIVFQEAFHTRARNILSDLLKENYPYQIGPANMDGNKIKTNSGLWVISKIPVSFVDQIVFNDCEGIDCWSKKGAALLEASYNGHTFQLIATHLESGVVKEVRERQYSEIVSQLLEPYKKEGVPQIICGDFNIDKSDKDSYEKMISEMNVNDYEINGSYKYTHSASCNDFRSSSCKDQYLIDYIFCRENNKKILEFQRYIQAIKQRWSKKHEDLSDHYAVLAEIRFD